MPSTQSKALRYVLGLPEVGVESSTEVLDIAAVHLAAQQRYPTHAPQPWGCTALLARLLEQQGAVNEPLIRHAICGASRSEITGPRTGLHFGKLSYLTFATI